MKNVILYFKRLDWILIGSAVLLVCLGLLSIYNSSLKGGNFFNFKKQIIFLIIGLFLMILMSLFDWRAFKTSSYLVLSLYFFTLILLIGLLFFAPSLRGVKSWYKLGPLYFEPVELAKIVLVILLAKYFSLRHIEMYSFRHILLSGIYVLVPVVLIFLQPDLGSALILIAVWIGILIISGIKIRHFLILTLIGLLIFSLGWSFGLKDYQKGRIINFVSRGADPLGIGWSQTQAKIAIGSGGIFGRGLNSNFQTRYGFLSEPQTDFIFAALAEEFGLVGVLFLLFLFSILIWRVMRIGQLGQGNFSRLFASGLAILIAFQTFLHIAVNLGLVPVIGISLPLVSYGGSNLIIDFLGFGILESIKINS